jgi:hypothetical protein
MNETTTGLMGEMLAGAAILSLGWRYSPCQQDRVDGLAFLDQTFLRVQVKTASLLRAKDGRASPRHHFNFGHGSRVKHLPTKDDFDVLCLVSPNSRRCLFMPITSVQQYSMRLPASRFTVEEEASSWAKTVDIILEMRR